MPDTGADPVSLREISTIARVTPARWPTPRRPYAPKAGGHVLDVAPGGSAQGDGSPGRPFATPNQALAAASSGDVIRVAAGTYALHTESEYGLVLDKNDIILTTRPNERATFTPGAAAITGINVTGDDVVIEGFEISGFRNAGIQFGRTDRPQRNLQILRSKVVGGHDALRSIPVDRGRATALIEGMLLYSVDIEQAGLVSFNCGEGPCNDVRIERVRILGTDNGGDTAADAIAFENGANLAIVDTEVTGVPGDGVDTKADGVVAVNVRVHDIGRNGIKLWRGGDVINCLIVNTGADAAIVFDEPGDYRILNTTVVRHSPGANAYSVTAASQSPGAGSLTVENSIFYRNSGGIFAPPEFRITVSNNLFFGTENGVEVAQGDRSYGQRGDNTLASLSGASSNVSGMDPRFTDEAAEDFSLGASSPALDRGMVATPMPDYDLAGKPRRVGAAPDLGPLERQ